MTARFVGLGIMRHRAAATYGVEVTVSSRFLSIPGEACTAQIWLLSILNTMIVLSAPGSLLIMHDNEAAFKEAAASWAEDDEEGKELADRLTIDEFTMDYFIARNTLMSKYGYFRAECRTGWPCPETALAIPKSL